MSADSDSRDTQSLSCDQVSIKDEVLEEGAGTADTGEAFLCEVCDERFLCVQHVLDHTLQAHAVALLCSNCKQPCQDEQQLQDHEATCDLTKKFYKHLFLCHKCSQMMEKSDTFSTSGEPICAACALNSEEMLSVEKVETNCNEICGSSISQTVSTLNCYQNLTNSSNSSSNYFIIDTGTVSCAEEKKCEIHEFETFENCASTKLKMAESGNIEFAQQPVDNVPVPEETSISNFEFVAVDTVDSVESPTNCSIFSIAATSNCSEKVAQQTINIQPMDVDSDEAQISEESQHLNSQDSLMVDIKQEELENLNSTHALNFSGQENFGGELTLAPNTNSDPIGVTTPENLIVLQSFKSEIMNAECEDAASSLQVPNVPSETDLLELESTIVTETNQDSNNIMYHHNSNLLMLKCYASDVSNSEIESQNSLVEQTGDSQSDGTKNSSYNNMVNGIPFRVKNASNSIMKNLYFLNGRINTNLCYDRYQRLMYCITCGKDIEASEYFRTHVENFLETKQCKCALCGRDVSQLSHVHFLFHLRNHLKQKYAKLKQCSFCKAFFYSSYSRNLHINKQHQLSDIVVPFDVPVMRRMRDKDTPLQLQVESEVVRANCSTSSEVSEERCKENAARYKTMMDKIKLQLKIFSGFECTQKKDMVIHCFSCCADFPVLSYFDTHFFQCMQGNMFHCPLCSSHKPQLDLVEHLSQLSQHICKLNTVFECKECNAVFLSALNHKLHAKLQHFCKKIQDSKYSATVSYIAPFNVKLKINYETDSKIICDSLVSAKRTHKPSKKYAMYLMELHTGRPLSSQQIPKTMTPKGKV